MKIVKTILLILWGFLTISLFLLALIQRQHVLKSEEFSIKSQSIYLNNAREMSIEYHRNIELLKENPINKNTIDSMYQTSEFLKQMNK